MTRQCDRARADTGQVTVFVVLFTIACLVVGAMVIDGGFLLAARRRAIVTADAAARAGADRISVDAYRTTGGVVLDPVAAADAARQLLDAAGYDGAVDIDGDRVVVIVRSRQPTVLLGIIGIRAVDVSGRGEARGVRGVVSAE